MKTGIALLIIVAFVAGYALLKIIQHAGKL